MLVLTSSVIDLLVALNSALCIGQLRITKFTYPLAAEGVLGFEVGLGATQHQCRINQGRANVDSTINWDGHHCVNGEGVDRELVHTRLLLLAGGSGFGIRYPRRRRPPRRVKLKVADQARGLGLCCPDQA